MGRASIVALSTLLMACQPPQDGPLQRETNCQAVAGVASGLGPEDKVATSNEKILGQTLAERDPGGRYLDFYARCRKIEAGGGL